VLHPRPAIANQPLPARVVAHAAAALAGPPGAQHPPHDPLAEPGTDRRWQQLQRLRRGAGSPEPWCAALNQGLIAPDPDLLAALAGRLTRGQVEALLDGPVGQDPVALFAAVRAEWPALAAQPAVAGAWLDLLLQHSAAAPEQQSGAWLQLLGPFRDQRVAQRLRAYLAAAPAPDSVATVLPMLGLQRCPEDGQRLIALALEPGPRLLRRQALEALAVGLKAWPPQPLAEALATLVGDLDPALAASAVDLLARLENAAPRLRSLLLTELDPAVRERLQRRLRCAPMVWIVHGRQGGVIPAELQTLALELASRRGAPVLLQALTGEVPTAEDAFWEAARRAGGITLVPLLLLPGGHVRGDVPRLAAAWRRAARQRGLRLRRQPFLGGWPAWQHTLQVHFDALRTAAPSQQLIWLHHPLDGSLAGRYLQHLAAVLQAPPCRAPFGSPLEALAETALAGPLLLQPLTLAANRLSETLADAVAQQQGSGPVVVQPPLLEQSGLRAGLLRALTSLP